MSYLPRSAVRILAIAALLGGTALSTATFAAGTSTATGSVGAPTSAASSEDTSTPAPATSGMAGKMQANVEQRISTLHTKLMITPDQEDSWNAVAQAMRDNESAISQLIQTRHANASSMTAVDDLNSYEAIAQAHADGLKNVASAFGTLYDSMSDDQKKNADKVFGTFEGHGPAAKHGKAKKSSAQ